MNNSNPKNKKKNHLRIVGPNETHQSTVKHDISQRTDDIKDKSIDRLSRSIDQLKIDQKMVGQQIARTILNALDQKDHYTFEHSCRVAHYSGELAREMGLSEDDIFDIELSGLFHDIGKIGIPDKVLCKPERLDEDEFQIMKSHPVKSEEIIKELPGFENVSLNVRHHHERYDGRGYPDSLKGNEIPLGARMILIADTFDAITSSRVYREAKGYKTAFDELNTFAGTQFDPQLVKAFIKVMERHLNNHTEEFNLSCLPGNYRKKVA